MARNCDIKKLPIWAQDLIKSLERRVESAEKTIPWTKPGMEWYTVLNKGGVDSRTLYFLYDNSAHAVCSIGPNDTVFVGRGKKYE